MATQIAEILLSFLRSGSSQTFVVLDVVSLSFIMRLQPVLVLLQGEEHEALPSLRGFHDGGDKLLQEVEFQQRGPEHLEKIDDQSFDMRAIIILIRHDHELSITQRRHIIVHCVESIPHRSTSHKLETQNLHEVVNLLVFDHRSTRHIANIQHLPLHFTPSTKNIRGAGTRRNSLDQ